VSAFIDQHRERFGVEPICRTLDVSESAYFARAQGRRSRRAIEDEQLVEAIRELHARNWYAYGYRRVWRALGRDGHQIGRDRVRRLMREHGIEGAKRRCKRWRTTQANLAAARPSDLVERHFSADRPDALWVADLTYLRSWQGVAYLAFVLDAYSRRIVGWQLATNMRTSLVLDALRMALSRRQSGADVELVHHSDAGSQYTSREFQQVLDDHRVLASIGSVGDAYDNALAESFVDTLKTELVADRVFPSRRALELAVVAWIGWYNQTRLHSSIDDCSPAEHEDRYYAAHQPAA
jgi:transposase InsO family protein